MSPEIISSAQEEDKPKDEPPPSLIPTGDEENQREDVPPPIQSHLDSGLLPTKQSSSTLVIFKSPNTYIGVTLMACAILADFVYYL